MDRKIQYITPRIAILTLSSSSSNKQQQQQYLPQTLPDIYNQLKQRHGNYFHVFNLTPFFTSYNNNMYQYKISATNFKWRDIPYSLTQTIKILSAMDAYLRCNIANSIVFMVNKEIVGQYCKFVIQCYCNILAISIETNNDTNSNNNSNKQLVSDKLLELTIRDALLNQFMIIYNSCDVKQPPIKYIQSVQFINLNQQQQQCSPFIPIFEIQNQFRHNGFETVYRHDIEQILNPYYLQLKQPLQTGIGSKYCQKKPQTKYLLQPCIVNGDVKISFYSYEKLVNKPQFIIGFNTKSLQYEQSVIVLKPQDWYTIQTINKQNNSNKNNNNNKYINNKHNNSSKSIKKQCNIIDDGKYKGIAIKICIAEYCQKCCLQAKCGECIEINKKITGRYQETQVQLEKLKRKRNRQEVSRLLSIYQ